MIDFLSDTVTVPTSAMREAMFSATVGDDCYGEDPTICELETCAATMTGKPASAFVTSGTLANLTALLAQCPRGHEVILGDQSDLYHYEAGGISVVGGAVLHPISTAKDGSLPLELLRTAIRDKNDYQCAPAAVIALENPHCLSGGRVLSLDYLARVRELADRHALSIHLDGARIFNAQASLGIPVKKIVEHVDSLQFCLSKSLGAPYGSMVCGSNELINQVKRYRKMLGGGLRQGGIMAAAGLVALRTMVQRLEQDHQRAAWLAEEIQKIPGVTLRTSTIETNMVFFDLSHFDHANFLQALQQQGIRMGLLGDGVIRAVLHHMIDDSAILQTIAVMKKILCPVTKTATLGVC